MEVEYETRDKRRAVLNWDGFLGDRSGALERVGQQLGLAWPGWGATALAEIDEFVTADLRHHTMSEEDLRLHPAVNELVREAYAAFLDLVDDPSSRVVQHELDNIRARFDDAAEVFDGALSEANEEGRRLRAHALAERQEISSRLEETRDELARAGAARESMTSELAAARDQLAALSAARDRLATEFAAENSARRTLANRLDNAIERIAGLEELVD